MPKKIKHNRHFLMLKVTADRVVRIPVKARNATSSVKLSPILLDLLRGDEGMSISCRNAQCALRQNSHAFPHEVHLAEFTDKRAYIVDKLDKQGVPQSCVVYAHEQGSFQKEFDTKKKNSLQKMSGIEKPFTLFPPPQGKGSGRGHTGGKTTSGTHRLKTREKKVLRGPRGAFARARRAGINIPVPLQPKSA